MTLPDTAILTSLVERVFRIDDVTSGDPQKGVIARYRGALLSRDTEAEYDRLVASLEQYGIVPLFRSEPSGRHVILLTPRPPAPKPARVSVNIILFVLTVFSVMLAGIQPETQPPPDAQSQLLFMVQNIFTGWPFAVSLLSILLAHEFGHYLMSRYHKTAATLPYFIPFPFSPLGTMGAAILMQQTPKNKRILFDIGVAGPWAGILVAIPVLFVGLKMSTLDVIQQVPGVYLEGNSLFYLFAKYLVFGQLLPDPVTTGGLPLWLYWLRYFFTGSPMPFGGTDVFIHPVAFAGWAGLLVTALNLLPAGTLDGGHLVYALFGEKASKAFPVLIVILGILGFFWSGWWLWAAILFWLGRVHAQPLDQITPLDPTRRVVAILTLVLFVLVFSPVPFVVF
jgi:membrane-associated protease RseP (regulator of RpoE activity)